MKAAVLSFLAVVAQAIHWEFLFEDTDYIFDAPVSQIFWSDAANMVFFFNDNQQLTFYDPFSNQSFWSLPELSPTGTSPDLNSGRAAWSETADGFYVFGGFPGSSNPNGLHLYEREANRWVQLSPIGTAPPTRAYPHLVWCPRVDGLLLYGGNSWYNDLHMYEREANRWVELMPYDGSSGASAPAREYASAAWSTAASGLYFFGGSSTWDADGITNDLFFYFVDVSNPTSTTVTRTTSTSSSRTKTSSTSSTVTRTSSTTQTTTSTSFTETTTANATSTTRTTTTSSSATTSSTALTSSISTSTTSTSSTANRWLHLIPNGVSPPPRWKHSMVASEVNGLFVFGGHGSTVASPWLFGDLWTYLHEANEWVELFPTGAVPAPRMFASIAWSNTFGGLFLWGGDTGDFGAPRELYGYNNFSSSTTSQTASTSTITTATSSTTRTTQTTTTSSTSSTSSTATTTATSTTSSTSSTTKTTTTSTTSSISSTSTSSSSTTTTSSSTSSTSSTTTTTTTSSTSSTSSLTKTTTSSSTSSTPSATTTTTTSTTSSTSSSTTTTTTSTTSSTSSTTTTTTTSSTSSTTSTTKSTTSTTTTTYWNATVLISGHFDLTPIRLDAWRRRLQPGESTNADFVNDPEIEAGLADAVAQIFNITNGIVEVINMTLESEESVLCYYGGDIAFTTLEDAQNYVMRLQENAASTTVIEAIAIINANLAASNATFRIGHLREITVDVNRASEGFVVMIMPDVQDGESHVGWLIVGAVVLVLVSAVVARLFCRRRHQPQEMQPVTPATDIEEMQCTSAPDSEDPMEEPMEVFEV